MVEAVHITADEEAKNKVENRHNPQRPDAEDLFLPARLQLQNGPQRPKKASQAEKETLKISGCGETFPVQTLTLS